MHLLKPRLSEKAYATAQATNTYVIDVPGELNKHEIAAAVEKQFDVKIASVRTVSRKGKVKRIMNITGRRQSNRHGVQADIKKAYVTLKPGSHLPFFEAEEKEAAEAAKADKKAEKTKVAPVAAQVAKAENKTSHRGLLRSRKSGEK